MIRRTEATSFTRKDVKPGHYNFVVQALGEDKEPVARTDFGGYVVLREDRDVVARRPSIDGLRAADRSAPPEPTRYVVVVLDADRQPVARSQVVRL